MKPMLASDAVEAKIKFPVMVQPKIDGVRGLNMLGPFTGRSLKSFANLHTTNFFSQRGFLGFDGELAAEHECCADLCRLTTSAIGTIAGEPWLMWHVFDYVTETTGELPYVQRLSALYTRLGELSISSPALAAHLKPIYTLSVSNLEQLEQAEATFLSQGYEGVILRDPNGKHKQGRSTAKEGGLLRIKRFLDAEAVVTGIVEGEANENEAQTNELGRQFRSSHKENKVANGLVGSMQARVLANVVNNGETVLVEGQVITVSPGRMTAKERAHYFENPKELIGKIVKFQFFPKGIKDKPRFPTFQSFRDIADIQSN